MTLPHSIAVKRILSVGMLVLTLSGGYPDASLPAQAGKLGTSVATSINESRKTPYRAIRVNSRPPVVLHLNRTCEERLRGSRSTLQMQWTDGETGNLERPAGPVSTNSFQRRRANSARSTGAIHPNEREDCPLIPREIRELLESRLSYC
jgi:hypothetical protein